MAVAWMLMMRSCRCGRQWHLGYSRLIRTKQPRRSPSSPQLLANTSSDSSRTVDTCAGGGGSECIVPCAVVRVRVGATYVGTASDLEHNQAGVGHKAQQVEHGPLPHEVPPLLFPVLDPPSVVVHLHTGQPRKD